MSTSTKTDKRVEIALPRAGEREDPNLYVGLNGQGYLLPRGKSSMVPEAVAREIRRSQRAREALDETMDSLQRTRP